MMTPHLRTPRADTRACRVTGRSILSSLLLCTALSAGNALADHEGHGTDHEHPSPSRTETSDIIVEHASAPATPPGAPTAVVYLDIQANSKRQLVGGESPLSQAVELHQMGEEDGMMTMRKVEGLDISADEPLRLQPGQPYHIMLIGLEAPLTAGSELPLTLSFSGGASIDLEVPVQHRDVMAADAEHQHGEHHHQ